MLLVHNLLVPDLGFLDRARELARLRAALGERGSLAVVYGRRRLGKSRLVREALAERRHVYYVGDARDAPLQRAALAREVARLLPGFADVEYADWAPLLERVWREAPRDLVVALDELPEIVLRSPELPSVLQKLVDGRRGPSLVVLGSSQRMMQGLVLDASAPLYGRASQILKIEPLPASWLGDALRLRSPVAIVEQHAAWGGVPRYWELARGHASLAAALEALVLDPLGALHREPDRLLLDDLTELSRAASLLALVARGCHRVSELAARLAVPATSLTRSLGVLLELGLLRRELPFGRSVRDSKRTLYRVDDPFLRTWYRFVEPNRSRLGAGMIDVVSEDVARAWPQHVGEHWEALVREAVPRMTIGGRRWGPPSRWWGRDASGAPLELDVVAASVDGRRVLVGEAKRSASAREARDTLHALEDRARRVPELAGAELEVCVFVLQKGRLADPRVLGAADVIAALR